MPREPGRQEVRLPEGLGRLGRTGLCARRAAGVVRREPGESQEKDTEEKERVAEAHWVPGVFSIDSTLLLILTKIL